MLFVDAAHSRGSLRLSERGAAQALLSQMTLVSCGRLYREAETLRRTFSTYGALYFRST